MIAFIIFLYTTLVGYAVISKTKMVIFSILLLPIIPLLIVADLFIGTLKQKKEAIIFLKVNVGALVLAVVLYGVILAVQTF